MTTSRSFLLCGLIVAAATLAIVFAGRRDEDAAPPDDAPLSVSDPFSLDVEIVDASWRPADPEAGESDSEAARDGEAPLLGQHEKEELARRDAELRKVLDPVDGLCVYVASDEPESPPDAGRPKPPPPENGSPR